MFRYPIYLNFKYIDKVSVYYLDPLNFRYDLLKTNALLRDQQKMAASKPIK